MNNINLILGAPGCGKTTKLMKILTEELKTNHPSRIAYVSFTRKGTYEGVERAKIIGGFKDKDLPYFRTLHSIAFKEGGYTKDDMISKSDYKTFSTAMGMKFTGYYTEEFFNNDDKYLFTHFIKRNNPIAAESYLQDMDMSKLKSVEHNYVRFKEFYKVHDFTDIIERFVQAEDSLPVDVAIIDEAQDLTTLQWRMCEIAFRNCKKVYIAGDDDQAIYEWSGADVKYFLNIKANETKILDKSYRLQKKILDLAKTVTKMMGARIEKQFDPIGDDGNIFEYNTLDDLAFNKDESWYFICRNNWHLQKYRDYLKKNAQVYIDKEEPSFDRKQIEAINIFEECRKTGKMSDIQEIKLRLHLKGVPDFSCPWYDNVNYPNDTIAYYRDLIRNKTNLQSDKLMVNTIHGVKGGEADNVVLLLDFTKAVKMNLEKSPDSELRCLYVAITRAKKHLHIIHSATKNGYDNYLKVGG